MRFLVVILAALSVSVSQDLHQEILEILDRVKRTPPEERYKVMNELKLKLRELSMEEREEMIREIYEELKGGREVEDRFEEMEHVGGVEEREEAMEDISERVPEDMMEKIEEMDEEERREHEH